MHERCDTIASISVQIDLWHRSIDQYQVDSKYSEIKYHSLAFFKVRMLMSLTHNIKNNERKR